MEKPTARAGNFKSDDNCLKSDDNCLKSDDNKLKQNDKQGAAQRNFSLPWAGEGEREGPVIIMAIFSFVLLAAYLAATARRYGLPEMVSDTYYQLGQRGWMFSLVMVTVAVMMMTAILDTGEGVQCLAFIGCSGLCFVGLAPNYCDKNAYPIHKGGAMVAAMGCVGWALSVCVWPTVAIAIAYVLYLIGSEICKIYDSVWHTSRSSFRTLYWGELACFADTFATYFVCQMINDKL